MAVAVVPCRRLAGPAAMSVAVEDVRSQLFLPERAALIILVPMSNIEEKLFSFYVSSPVVKMAVCRGR